MAQVSSLKVPLTTKGITLQVGLSGLRAFRVRAWLGIKILQLAAWVIGLELEVSIRSEHPAPATSPSLAIPPVRLSVADLDRPDAPVRWQDATRIRVSLDGVEQRSVIAYDCEAGTVERFVRDKLGEYVLTPDRQSIVRETVKGVVTAEYREPA